jgi:hypothetical protein
MPFKKYESTNQQIEVFSLKEPIQVPRGSRLHSSYMHLNTSLLRFMCRLSLYQSFFLSEIVKRVIPNTLK